MNQVENNNFHSIREVDQKCYEWVFFHESYCVMHQESKGKDNFVETLTICLKCIQELAQKLICATAVEFALSGIHPLGARCCCAVLPGSTQKHLYP